jgi:hypothetical protein
LSEWEGFEVTLPDGAALIVTSEGTDILGAGELRTIVETIRRLDFGMEGGGETLWDDEGDVVLVRSRAGVWSVPAGEVRAIWPHCRRLGLPEEGVPLMLVAFREAGLR